MLLREVKERIDIIEVIQYLEAKKRIFISYTHKNPDHKKYVRLIGSKLKENFEVWIDHESLNPDLNQDEMIETGILSSDLFIAFVSKDYCGSPNCIKEFELAERSFIKEKKPKILPVMLDDIEKIGETKGMRVKTTHLNRFYAYKEPNVFNPWNAHFENCCDQNCSSRHSDELYCALVSKIKEFFQV